MNSQKKYRLWKVISATAIIALALSGCLKTRGVMYLKPKQVGVYLSETKGESPPEGIDSNTWKYWREQMPKVPDGNRILGGFCTDKRVLHVLDAIDQLGPTCQKRLYREMKDANFQGKLFWSFVGVTASSGLLAIIFAAVPIDPEARAWLGFTFGTISLTSAMVNFFGGFDARQEKFKMRAKQLDNFMWTLRLRISNEVCNAPDVQTARRQIVQIYRMTLRFCTAPRKADGSYYIPTGINKFENEE